MDSFTYVQSALVTPLLLLSGVFFPISGFPQWVQSLAQVNPLFHCVELVRDAVFGWEPVHDLVSVLVLCLFAAVMGFLAVRVLRRRLID
jgi:lipooligosaccharide transport system permease protein